MNNEEYDYNYDNLVPEWNYEEFAHLKPLEEKRTAFARAYYFNNGHFYIEPWFYTTLTRLFERFPKQKQHILDSFFALAGQQDKVLFTKDVQNPIFKDNEYLYIEIEELISKADLVFDDISRGSDYGD